MMRLSTRLVVMIVLGLTLLSAAPLAAAPQAELWPRWEAHDPASTVTIDHGEWGAFLAEYLVTGDRSGVNLVRYGHVTPDARRRLQAYIADLERVPVSALNRDEQLAYWTNLYNAVTIELILEHYPVSSIRDIRISGPALNRHPWDAPLVTVEGERITLNDIEHRIMRPIWDDPRIHYAVNCASIGCPNLQSEPFTGANWDELYTRAAREFVNHPRAIDLSGSRPLFSSIYDWYQVDFGGSIAGVVDHALGYADAPLAERLRAFAATGHRGRPRFEYDWSLNVAR